MCSIAFSVLSFYNKPAHLFMNQPEIFTMDTNNDEVKKLEKVSFFIFIFLSVVIVAGSLVLILTVNSHMIVTSACIAGVIGSATAALLSSLSRKASGYELMDGTYFPEPKDPNQKVERFCQRMATFFFFRPFLGVIAGLIIYYGGDILGVMDEESISSISTATKSTDIRITAIPGFKRIIFFSLLAGLFAKTLIEILKGSFKGFFGRG